MTGNNQIVNGGDTAPIKNVAACLTLVHSLQNRHPLQPNLGVFAGFSGYGKSVAACYAMNKTNAAYVEVSDTWTKKKLLTSILSELGQPDARGTLSDLEDDIIGILARDPKRPLIIDESDKLVDRNMIELVRMIAKKSNVPVLLIGEELFPKKLERVDRFRDLVLEWGYAQPCDLEDTRTLAKTFCRSVSITDDLLDQARIEGDGRVRRICNTLHSIANTADEFGLKEVSLAQYQQQGSGYFCTGAVPSRNRRAA